MKKRKGEYALNEKKRLKKNKMVSTLLGKKQD